MFFERPNELMNFSYSIHLRVIFFIIIQHKNKSSPLLLTNVNNVSSHHNRPHTKKIFFPINYILETPPRLEIIKTPTYRHRRPLSVTHNIQIWRNSNRFSFSSHGNRKLETVRRLFIQHHPNDPN